jgi:hypothetical protein
MLTFEVRNLGSFWEGGEEAGASTNSVFGETGYYVRRGGFFDYKNKPIQVERELPPQEGPFTHFFRAVRSRKQTDQTVSVGDVHVSCLHCQIGNIAYRMGQTLFFDPDSERFLNNQMANDMMRRDYREGFEVPEIT